MTNLEKCYPSNRNLSVDYPINFHPKAKRKLKKKHPVQAFGRRKRDSR